MRKSIKFILGISAILNTYHCFSMEKTWAIKEPVIFAYENVTNLYNLGVKFKKQQGPILTDNKEKSCLVAQKLFISILKNYGTKISTDNQIKEIVNKTLYEITKYNFKKGNGKEICFLNFIHAKKKGISKADKYLEKIRQENSFDLEKFLKEDHSLGDMFDLGRLFLENKGPIFVGNLKESNKYGLKCFLYIEKKYEGVCHNTLTKNVKDMLANTYFVIGQSKEIMHQYNDAYRYYSTAFNLGLEAA